MCTFGRSLLRGKYPTETNRNTTERHDMELNGNMYRGTEQTGRTDIAIARVEQVTPFPFDKVAKQIKRYSNAEVGCSVSLFLSIFFFVVFLPCFHFFIFSWFFFVVFSRTGRALKVERYVSAAAPVGISIDVPLNNILLCIWFDRLPMPSDIRNDQLARVW